MAREIYYKNVKFSVYSIWHRKQHDAISMSDCDKVATCIACSEPLFLAETVFDNNQGWKKYHKVTKRLAELAGLPAYVIWYKVLDKTIEYVHVKKIAPDYPGGFKSDPIKYTPDQWLQYLEAKQVEHFPHCKNKDYFLSKLNNDPKTKTRKVYEAILSK
jgi:hypothetical protein